jgi:bifunctional non-homologous end joining protein LigD
MPRSDYTPQLATLVKAPPSGDEWLHEIKYDGYRIGIRVRGGRATLISRSGRDWTSAFPEVAAAAAALRVDSALIDGEAAIVLADGRTSFQALQNASTGTAARGALAFFAFDLLEVDGERLDRLPLLERKSRLRRVIGTRTGRIRYSEHVQGRGDTFFAEACRMGLEGIISKLADQPYRAGRSRDWLKTKCVLRQEFVIGGFTDPEGRRAGIGALLIGYYDDARLVYAGKVGTGFGQAVALDLRRRLGAIERKTPAFEPAPRGLGRGVHWVAPSLVCEVAFTEWTGDGKIRHPSFQGLRRDKPPRAVTRERAVETPTAPPPARRKARMPASRDRAAASTPSVAGVAISNPDRVVYPDERITKFDVARYYEAIADWVVPHVAGRPLTLVRCPEGIGGDCFFLKHSKVWARGPLRRVRIQEKTKVGEYLVADDLPAIVGLVQTGILEIHTWNTRDVDLERPDRLVIDLDPGDAVPWKDVVHAGRVVRRALAALDLESFPKTTGGRGLHVVVPLVPHADWSECLAFTRRVCEALERADRDRFTTQFAKAGREGKILLDYLRNNRTNTSIAAYSTRARPGATVSVPLTWAQLRPALSPQRFTIRTVPRHLERLETDPWRDYWTCRQKLTAQRLRAVGARANKGAG